MNGNRSRTAIPYIVALVGGIIGVAANFLRYLTASGWFYTRTYSILEMILECIDDPQCNLVGTEVKIVFGLILAGVIFAILALLFVILKKMTPVIVFSILACLPFLMLGQAWVHYIGYLVSVVGAIWYKTAKRKTESVPY